jgi:hypothetical protein
MSIPKRVREFNSYPAVGRLHMAKHNTGVTVNPFLDFPAEIIGGDSSIYELLKLVSTDYLAGYESECLRILQNNLTASGQAFTLRVFRFL